MRRDMDLIRRILKAAADSPGPVPIDLLTTDADGRAKVGEHLRLLREAGLAECSFVEADGDPFYVASVDRLTWEGQDLLASVESPDVWAKVKTRLARAGGEVALSTVKALALKVAAESLGL